MHLAKANPTNCGAMVRWMILRDLGPAMEIEKQCFEFPWTEAEFMDTLRTRNCIGLVAEHDNRVVGFLLIETHPGETRIISLAVCPWYQRQGIGSSLFAHAKRMLLSARRRMYCEVRESNLDAQLFWQAHGFRAIQIIKDQYEETPEDAYLMEWWNT